MRKTYLLAGLSALAFAASGANAQNANSTTSNGVGNSATCVNNTLGSTGNSCTITQDGNGNGALIRQPGSNNTGTVDQDGDNNSATLRQQGWYNTGSIDQDGSSNTATIGQPGWSNNASIAQTGSSLNANIQQGNFDSDAGSYDNGNDLSERNVASSQQSVGATGAFSDINQNGDDNSATVLQSGQDSDSFLYTYGVSNSASVNQSGEESVSVLVQRNVNIGGISSSNSATVVQTGADTYSYLGQEGTSNTASITLTGAGRDKPRRPTSTDYAINEPAESEVLQIGLGNSVTVNQSGNLDRAIIYQGVDGDSYALQTGFFNTASVTQSSASSQSTILQGSQANVARTFQQNGSNLTSYVEQHNGTNNEVASFQDTASLGSSTVDQNGSLNYAEITQNSGVNFVDPVTGKSAGNSSTITQNGQGSTADVSQNVKASARANFQGLGNVSQVTQTTAVAYQARGGANTNQTTTTASEGRVGYQEFGSSGNYTGSRGNYSSVWQQGQYGFSNIQQGDGADSGKVYNTATQTGGGIARARAGVYQSGRLGTVGVFQTGDNYGEVTQGIQGADVGGVVNLVQTDSGDVQTGTIPAVPPTFTTVCDPVGNCQQVQTSPGSPAQPIFARAYNQALLGQFGNNNNMQVTQNAKNAYVSARQRSGSANLLLDLEQGTARSNAFANSGSGGPQVAAPINNSAVAGASTAATLNVDQGGINNGAQVSQDSNNSFITVVQLGTGSAPVTNTNFQNGVIAGQAGGNVIIVAQQGGNNRATARQEATVGRSGNNAPESGNSAATNTALNGTASPADDFYFAGGSRSAEIDILQGGTGNTATATQRGLGQYARIEQAGSGNTASITQEQAATNATAIIRQSGTGNSYYVTQNAPGQYIAVNQYGTGNNANNVVTRGPAGGSAGFTPPSP